MQQLPLGVRVGDRAIFASFLPGPNAQALEHLQRVARAEACGTSWVCGPPGVGKTHLLQATCVAASERMRAGYFPLRELLPLGVGSLEGLPQLDCLSCDDLELAAGQEVWERALFGLFREIEERQGRLIVSAASPPTLLHWTLPDLGSRFAASAIFQLRPLADAQQVQALQLHARTRGLELPDDAARWMLRRFPRDMHSLHELLEKLDEAALVAQRRLTVPFIRNVLRE